jgi:hypothetical protein
MDKPEVSPTQSQVDGLGLTGQDEVEGHVAQGTDRAHARKTRARKEVSGDEPDDTEGHVKTR